MCASLMVICTSEMVKKILIEIVKEMLELSLKECLNWYLEFSHTRQYGFYQRQDITAGPIIFGDQIFHAACGSCRLIFR